jgi:hypothetical protein
MNKRGFIGWIIIGIFVLILVVIGFIGITVYQVYSFGQTILKERVGLEAEVEELARGNCSKVVDIELRIDRIKTNAESTCKNPLIRYFVNRTESIPVKCDQIEKLYESTSEDFNLIKKACTNENL